MTAKYFIYVQETVNLKLCKKTEQNNKGNWKRNIYVELVNETSIEIWKGMSIVKNWKRSND